jgi:hypothetical protein
MASPTEFTNQILRILRDKAKVGQPQIEQIFLSQTKRFVLCRFSSAKIAEGMLKLLVKPSSITAEQFRREITVLEWFLKTHPDCVHVPKIFDYSLEPESWHICTYIKGYFLNDQRGSFFYQPNRLQWIDSQEVIKFFLMLSENSFMSLDLPTHNQKFLRPKFDQFLGQIKQGRHSLSSKTRKWLTELFSDRLEWLFDVQNYCLLHYDLQPTNTLVNKENNLVILDWENAAQGHFLGDLVNFWARSLLLADWHERFLNSVLKEIGQEKMEFFYQRFLLQSVGILNYLEAQDDRGYVVMTVKIEEAVKELS